jgi:hypothetical protein
MANKEKPKAFISSDTTSIKHKCMCILECQTNVTVGAFSVHIKHNCEKPWRN